MVPPHLITGEGKEFPLGIEGRIHGNGVSQIVIAVEVFLFLPVFFLFLQAADIENFAPFSEEFEVTLLADLLFHICIAVAGSGIKRSAGTGGAADGRSR